MREFWFLGLFQFFLKGQEVGRPAVQIEAMEPVIRVFFSPELLCLLLEGQDLQIPQIIFQVITGFLSDVGVYGAAGIAVGNAETLQYLGNLVVGGSLIVDHDIQHGIQAQLHTAVVLFQFRDNGVGIEFLLPKQFCGIIIGDKLHIQGPALLIAAVP